MPQEDQEREDRIKAEIRETYRPRNDLVLVEIVHSKVGRLIMPDQAQQGKNHIVRQVGPKVTELKPGDIVLVFGRINVDWITLPNQAGFYVTKEANVAMVMGQETPAIEAPAGPKLETR